ncbi:hypothetical protein HY3_16095 [Hyphomonas pacifica]|uniref:AB hydrolase-1 domain-containing protein n=2 Tax=Hyphomonas pacifica TaxID=1280941 RepID=A0A062TZZ8_9PROT|nr:hypothetical protein HY2_15310 [Hyphomonas pacifica]RAN31899.1 hypothetical protein HY3_16095 [Hyphomonas pacifica]
MFSALPDGRGAVAWDMPGYQGSRPIATPVPEAVHYAECLRDLVVALGLGPCVMIGHSLGALVAGAFVRIAPEQVSGLILADPALGYAEKSSEAKAKVFERVVAFHDLGAEEYARQRAARLLSESASAEALSIVQSGMSALHEPAYARAVHMLAHGNLYADLRHWHGPIHFISGAQDIVTPPAGTHDLAERLAAPFDLIAPAGHASYVERPRAFADLVARICDSWEY